MSERAGLLSSTQKNPQDPDPRSLYHLLLFLLHTPPVVGGYVQSIYMENAARRHTPLENRSVSEGLNESGEPSRGKRKSHI